MVVSIGFQIQFEALIKKLHLDAAGITQVAVDPSYREFLSGSVDVTGAFFAGGVIRLLRAGHRLNIIWPVDYGIRFYSGKLVASNEIIPEKPDVVTRF